MSDLACKQCGNDRTMTCLACETDGIGDPQLSAELTALRKVAEAAEYHVATDSMCDGDCRLCRALDEWRRSK